MSHVVRITVAGARNSVQLRRLLECTVSGATLTRGMGWTPEWGTEKVMVIEFVDSPLLGAAKDIAEGVCDIFKQTCVYRTVDGTDPSLVYADGTVTPL